MGIDDVLLRLKELSYDFSVKSKISGSTLTSLIDIVNEVKVLPLILLFTEKS